MCSNVLPAYVCVYRVNAWCPQWSEEGFTATRTGDVHAGNQTQVYRSSRFP